MSLEIQTSSGPRHVSTALVKSTDDGRHGNKEVVKTNGSQALCTHGVQSRQGSFFRELLTLLFLFALSCQRQRWVVTSIRHIHSGENSSENLIISLDREKPPSRD